MALNKNMPLKILGPAGSPQWHIKICSSHSNKTCKITAI